jgi:hypothetical protein
MGRTVGKVNRKIRRLTPTPTKPPQSRVRPFFLEMSTEMVKITNPIRKKPLIAAKTAIIIYLINSESIKSSS